jgi:20S proteasome alpha/beta subunit
MNKLHKNRESCTKMPSFAQKWQDENPLGIKDEERLHFEKKSKRKRRKDMTVCIAAIYESNTEHEGVMVVADRQITDANTNLKSKAPYAKIYPLSVRIVALIADDMSLQNELIQETNRLVDENQARDNLTVKQVVEFYNQAYAQKVRQHAERHILMKQGLTFDTFFEKQKNGELNETATDLIMRALGAHKLPYKIQTIIAGIDSKGAHICVIDDDDITWETETGYAAIGCGREHAESQFKLAQFNKYWTAMDVAFMCYTSKKRTEVIEGVGGDTDMVIVLSKHPTPTVVPIVPFLKGIKDVFEKEYLRLEKQIEKDEKKARERMRKIAFAAEKEAKAITDKPS